MSDRKSCHGPSTVLVDWMFARIGGDTDTPPPTVRSASVYADDPEVDGPSAGEPPPGVNGSVELRAAYEWLQRERRRLEGYTQSQLQRLRGEHQAMVQQNYLNEEALILQSQ